ncbi:hypothetical protein HY500_04450 [Candidatus Woesearchaeota archaeon]|nr:hypothetical protein [Candidatus Woesearchaeota archaeon]
MIQQRSWEVSLGDELFQAAELDAVFQEARRRGLVFTELRVDIVVDRGCQWKSREESTKPTPLIYLEIGRVPEALILQGPEDELYRMFKYKIHTS